MKKILISFVVACELMLTAYSANKFVPLRTNTVFSGEFSVKGKHPKVKNPSMFLANSSAKLIDAVAEVDGYSYSSIQDAIAAAVGHGTAQVDIIKNASLDKPLSIIGKSIDETNIKLNINQDVVVTFTNREIPGIMIDNATVEFIGDGTWFKFSNDPHYPTKTMVCVGERAIDCKLAPARVVVTSGTFDCGHSNVFRVKNGQIVVNGGIFKIHMGNTRYCVVAEPSDVKDCVGNIIPDGHADIEVNCGTFITPMESIVPPCAVKYK